MEPVCFSSPEEFRAWLEQHHATERELLVGFYKTATGLPSMRWAESVDEALCFGWIDGVRRTVDAERYTIRFTPRRPGSNWSEVNIRRAQELTREGRMRPAGLKAFEARRHDRSGVYSFEQRKAAELTADEIAAFRANAAAWSFWERQPAGYRKTATWWVVSAKRNGTRARRLRTLIADSEAGLRIGPLRR